MTSTNLTDHFLIAMPDLDDGNFSRSVTYICEHNEEGSLGITINRLSPLKLSEILDQLSIQASSDDIADYPVYVGGPVHQDRGFILHSPAGDWASSLKVNDAIAITTSKDILTAIADNKGPQDILITLGYAGWGPGQLEQEMSQNAWLSCPANHDIMFHVAVEKRWERAAQCLGIDLQLLSHDTGHA